MCCRLINITHNDFDDCIVGHQVPTGGFPGRETDLTVLGWKVHTSIYKKNGGIWAEKMWFF